MPDQILFTEGANELLNNGLPSTCYFLLSTLGVDVLPASQHVVTETLGAANLGEITGTGYARKSQAEPTASGGTVSFASMTWNTGAATNWPAAVRSVVLATGAAGSGKAICAWNILPGGGPVAMNAAGINEIFQPTLTLS